MDVRWLCRLNTASVLIQLTRPVHDHLLGGFKYSICSYSTQRACETLGIVLKFKYSICSYSTSAPFGLPVQSVAFKYSICSYSTSQPRREIIIYIV